jgi:hypothetical protein
VTDRYGSDVLARDPHGGRRPRSTERAVEIGLVVEDAQSGYVGAVVAVEYGRMQLEDRNGRRRSFPVGPGYLIDGKPVILNPPLRRPPPAAPTRTASGSVAVTGAGARIALASRIYVEHLGGIDDLVDVVAEFGPSPGRRLGVLVDHLVAGSKETRIAEAVRRGAGGADTLVVGHPFIDIWQAVKPARLGLKAWPVVPRGTDWKHGICDALGWPHAKQADVADAWRRIRASVRDWNDLEPALIGRVEELIDFVTTPAS